MSPECCCANTWGQRGALGGARLLTLRGARGRNLKDLDVEIPLGCLVAVTGVSGSGKSTLVTGTLEPALMRALGQDVPPALAYDKLEGVEELDAVIQINSAPIGRTPRSNPATRWRM